MAETRPTPAQALGQFAAELDYATIPGEVVRRAKDCIIDTVGAATFGARFPWSRMVSEYARRYGAGGICSIIGDPDARVHAPYAALANGVRAHAFEQDSVRDPGAGSHPGATLMPAVLAISEETRADGKAAIAAFVAGCEVMFRVALASHHSPEKVGFHAPGLTGPYGVAVAVARLLGLNAEQVSHAIGIAGSLSSGLLAFTKSRHGGMVKRLHMGRASESGILAARLAQEGYTGPETVLEGKFGFLDAYCLKEDRDPELLTEALGTRWETMRICMKRYACHINAHTPVQALRAMMGDHAFAGADVARVVVQGSNRLLTHHNIAEPGDIMQGQYSVPFCVGLALHRDPEDPKSFDAAAITDPVIRDACRRVELRLLPDARSVRGSRVTVTLNDGREFSLASERFKGMPDDPLAPADLRRKFMLLTSDSGAGVAAGLFERLDHLEEQSHFSLR